MPTPALLELQRAFARALLREDQDVVWRHIADDGFTPAERLNIYRNTCRSVLIETLRMTYPAVDRLVGREFFDMAAARFIRAHPCRSGYLNEYGAELADFLAALEPASGLPYLADVARFEWALGLAANALDAPALDAAALGAVKVADHASLRFEPHPSVRLLSLAYPADEIADAVLSGDEAAMAEVEWAGRPARLVVHRGPDGVEAKRLEREAYEFLSRLCAGEPLGRLVESAPGEAPLLLAEALAKGRLAAFHI
jgi:hypothetical protein